MKRSPRLTQGFTRTLDPKLERFIRVNPTAVELIRKKPSQGPQNGKWLKRASFIALLLHDYWPIYDPARDFAFVCHTLYNIERGNSM